MVRSWLEYCIGSVESYNEEVDDAAIPEYVGDNFDLDARSSESNDSDSGASSLPRESLEDRYHKSCAYNSNPGYISTRILELRDESSQNWRVCMPVEDGVELGVYATISY
jgi:hypothetical protein